METTITVSPRYGRDYKSAEEAQRAFLDHRDFTVRSGPWAGAAVSIGDCRTYGIRSVVIRYDRCTKSTILEVPTCSD